MLVTAAVLFALQALVVASPVMPAGGSQTPLTPRPASPGRGKVITIPLKVTALDKRDLHERRRMHRRGPASLLSRDGDSNFENEGSSHNVTLGKRNLKQLPLKFHQEGVSLWAGEVGVGTPPQLLPIQFGTGSNDFIVHGPKCTVGGVASKHCFTPGASTSAHKLNEPADEAGFGDGTKMKGMWWTDSVHLQGLTLPAHRVLVADEVTVPKGKEYDPTGGIMGLCYGGDVFEALVKGQQVDPILSFHLTPQGGALYIGGVNTELSPADKWVHAAVIFPPQEGSDSGSHHEPLAHWDIKVDSVSVGATAVAHEFVATIDTGANFIYGTEQAVKAIYAKIPEAKIEVHPGDKDTYYVMPCTAKPSVTFTVGGHPLPMRPSTFILHPFPGKVGSCFAAIQTVAGNEDWVLGGYFMQNFQVSFNQATKQVGFGELTVAA